MNKQMSRMVGTGLMLAGLALPGSASATTVSLSGTTYNARPVLGGWVVEDSVRDIYCTGGAYLGTVQDRVVQESSTGTLDFYRRIVVNSSSTLTVSNSKEFMAVTSIDADYRTDSLGDYGPNQLIYSTSGSNTVFDFSFSSRPDATYSSHFYFVKTPNTGYAATGVINITAWTAGGVPLECLVNNTFKPN